MKKRLFLYLTMVMLLTSTFMININAAWGSASISAPGSVAPNSRFDATVSVSANEGASFDLTITSTTGDQYSWAPAEAGSRTFTFSAGSSGSVGISVSGDGAPWSNPEAVFGVSGSTSVSIRGNSGGGNPGGGSGGGGNSGGSSNNGSSNSGGGSASDSNNSNEKDQQEKPEEETGMLVTNIKVLSASEKDNGKELTNIQTAMSEFGYNYTLPKGIDKATLDVVALDSEVHLTYDKDVSFNADENNKNVTIVAIKGDVEQNYTIAITKSDAALTAYTVDGKDYRIVDEPAVDDIMKELGFEREVYDEKDGKTKSFSYLRDATRIQLLQNDGDEKDLVWMSLTDRHEQNGIRQLYAGKDKQVLLLPQTTPEAYRNQTVQDVRIEKIALNKETLFDKKDSIIPLATEVEGWKYQEGMIVNAFDTQAQENFYYIDGTTGEPTLAVVSFNTNNDAYKVWAYSATAVSVILLISGVAYLVYEYTKTHQNNKPRKSETDSSVSQ